jgi:hypothetical protein
MLAIILYFPLLPRYTREKETKEEEKKERKALSEKRMLT